MPKPHPTALMPVGTVIEHDGTQYLKTHESRREPFPWATIYGGEYGDERMAHLLAGGGEVVEVPHETKMAKDLPVGAEVYGRGITYTKDQAEGTYPWVSDDGQTLTDGMVDMRLADGAFITRVPIGTQTKGQ